MFEEDTPYKLKEIIMDTWPQLFWLKDFKKNDDRKPGTRGECDGRESLSRE